MTLDQAIDLAKYAADNTDYDISGEWRQVVEWLRTARGAKDAGRWSTQRINALEDENKRLRELVRDMYEVAHRRTAYGWVAVEEAMQELGIEVEQ